ncbi:hypothetical protein L5515_019660 [Caenorhabditis briggsae]|uniref:Uncharacterized protein n=1 Tax=Caenorhabditis briggsae TaxID=6238 RepID=A0AAE9FJG7_CAEBR|nr:hypothetical protein L5515_019660 [Caenorhabditis briggsae]
MEIFKANHQNGMLRLLKREKVSQEILDMKWNPDQTNIHVSGRRLCKTINQRKSGHRIEDWRSHYDKDKWRNSNGRYPHLQTES